MLRIPLDVIVLIAEKCVKKDFKTILKFACCCKRLYNKPYIKKEYLKAKRQLLKNFLEKNGVWATVDIILNVNGIEENINQYREYTDKDEWFTKRQYRNQQKMLEDKIFHIFWNSQWRPKNEDWHGLAVNNSIDDFDIPFVHISTGLPKDNTEYKPIKRLFWTEWAGITKINIEFCHDV